MWAEVAGSEVGTVVVVLFAHSGDQVQKVAAVPAHMALLHDAGLLPNVSPGPGSSPGTKAGHSVFVPSGCGTPPGGDPSWGKDPQVAIATEVTESAGSTCGVPQEAWDAEASHVCTGSSQADSSWAHDDELLAAILPS